MTVECPIALPIHETMGETDIHVELPIPPTLSDSSPRSPFEYDALSLSRHSSSHRKSLAASPPPTVGKETPTRRCTCLRVSFDRRIKTREIYHVSDLTQEEAGALWMTAPDYQLIKATVKATVMMMMNGEFISHDDEDFCSRGVECRTRVGAKMRSRHKLRCRSAVLNEQDMQQEEGFSDPQFIAMVCMEESMNSREEARLRGEYDERCIQEYMGDARAVYGV